MNKVVDRLLQAAMNLPDEDQLQLVSALTAAVEERGLRPLDDSWLEHSLEYLPLNTAAMRLAAELWAQARNEGLPTGPDPALNGDIIFAAQAITPGVPVVVATTNVSHFIPVVPVEPWSNIKP